MGYELALADLESSLRPEIFSYLLSVINAEQANVEIVIDKAREEKINISKSLGSDSTGGSSSILDKCDEFGNLSGNTISSTGSGSKLYLPSLQRSHRSIAPSSALCSHLPICRKILFKLGHKETSKRMTRSREYFQENKDAAKTKTEDLPFKNIIGKISQSEPPEFDRGRKLTKPPPGIREFTQAISNPLYRNYNPRGYVKNDDEIAREFIKDITHTFNQWLASFDGDLVQLEPDVMIKILRDDLEHSFLHSTLEENQPEPVAYKSRFWFDQPSIKLDLTEE